MRGHIRERSPGHWAIVLDVRDPASGKRRRKWHSFAGTKRAAQIECARLISELQSGMSLDPSRVTVAAYLKRWLDHVRSQVSPRTLEVYGETVARIVPHIGNVALSKLRPDAVAAMYAAALKRWSPRTVHMMHRLIRSSS